MSAAASISATNPCGVAATGWKSGSAGWYIAAYGIGRTMSASGSASARNGASARSPAATSPVHATIAITIEPAVVLGRQERHRRRGHHVGDRRELVRRRRRRGDEAGDDLGASPAG